MTCDSNEAPKVALDERGRVASVSYPRGGKEREFTYVGDTDEINRVVVRDKDRGTTRVFIKQYATLWIVCNEIGKKLGEWRGSVQVSPSGAYCVTTERRPGNSKSASFYA